MSAPNTAIWFARHEARLAWRDWVSLMTAGRRRRARTVAIGFGIYVLFVHGLAWVLLPFSVDAGSRHARVVITGTLIVAGSLMLSQALESVTRAFYARGDLELILTSPAAAPRLFAIRIAAMAAATLGMGLVLSGPFINIMAWRCGARWLACYGVAAALAMASVALAVVITVALFRAIGPRRTRLVSQILAALIGAGFAIGMQCGAIMAYGTMPRMTVLNMTALGAMLPADGSRFWWPAHAMAGDPRALAALLAAGAILLGGAIAVYAPRFGSLALTAGSVPDSVARFGRRPSRFRAASPAWALRRKEWTLLLRDPWLVSQTLMQLLYLLPAAFILWRDFRHGGVPSLLVPILIVAAGQLGGGLAWLAVSGEDAPDLIASAPIAASHVLRAKAEAVLGGILLIFTPFILILALLAPLSALAALAGTVIAAGSSTAIQYWFRAQSRRSLFRRRQTSSRIATFAEAASSTLWAGVWALVAAGSWYALMPGAVVLLLLAGAWAISPARHTEMA
jgi:ABC-2 type transport system permease protein